MIEYSYNNIKIISSKGIIFNNDFEISFEECKKNWAISHNIEIHQTRCVAESYYTSLTPYIIFYGGGEKIKLVFDNRGIRSNRKNRNDYIALRNIIIGFGFSFYDMT